MISEKINNFLNAPEEAINLGEISKTKLNEKNYIYWGNEKIGLINKGSKIFTPTVEILNSEYIESENKLLISAKLQSWLDKYISEQLHPIKNNFDENINANVRAIAYNCFENLGTIKIDNYKDFIKKIDLENKQQLSKFGIRIGAKYFFMPNLMRKKPLELKSLLWKVFNQSNLDHFLPLPSDGRVSFTLDFEMPESYWQAIGYICVNKFAFRVDMFEKIFYLARKKIKYGPFLENADLMNPIGCNTGQLQDILNFCGYQVINLFNQKKLYFFKQRNNKVKKNNSKIKLKTKNQKNNRIKRELDPNSPFAVLEKLL